MTAISEPSANSCSKSSATAPHETHHVPVPSSNTTLFLGYWANNAMLKVNDISNRDTLFMFISFSMYKCNY